ncbi:MAG TPA: HlyD family efflux transporter periplasmic adaptor subunit [Humisphaera sp.]
MIRKYVLPALALLGVLFGIFMVRAGAKPPKVAEPVAQPARAPVGWDNKVAGSGLVEAATENIALGTPVPGVVTNVYVQVGAAVRAGLPHETVRRIAPLVTAGAADEAYDDMVLAAPDAAATRPATTNPADLSPAATRPAKVNLNTASPAELAALPGLAPADVDRIVAGRPYASIWDLEGTPLFKIDDRQARSDLAVKRAAAQQARQKLAKALLGTRPEELAVGEAQVAEAQAAFDTAKRNYERWAKVQDQSAIPPDELANRESMMKEMGAKLRSAQATLDKLRAGTWAPDVEIARAELQAAEAQVRTAQTELDRLTVRAPIDGTVLQVKVRPGEYAPSGVMQTPLMLVGRTDVLHIRVDVDEHEALRVRPEAEAVASIRGDSAHQVKLKFVRLEPYVVPKKSLTGDSSERVDTRVMQVVYAFDPKELRALVGQQMDVFIKDLTVPATTAPTTQAK